MRRSGVVATVVVGVLGALAPAALALPGDPAFGPTAPPDGARLQTDPDGIPVAFSCPVYRISDAGGTGFVQYGGPRDYGVSFAKAAATGPDGRLADPVALGSGSPVPGQQDACQSAMAAGGSVRPQDTPGTYFWQVWRLCTGCPTGYETGPVQRFVLGSAARPRLRTPSRAYAGYATLVRIVMEGVPDRTPIVVERRSGSRWVRMGAGQVVQGGADVVITPRAGSQRLRARARLGDEDLTSPLVTLRGRTGGARTAVRTGAWRSTGDDDTAISFRVTGRTLRGLEASVPMLCPSVTAGQFTTQIGTAAISRARIAPDGSFVAAATRSGSAIRVRGRLRGSRLTGGRVELSVGSCSGTRNFAARRR